MKRKDPLQRQRHHLDRQIADTVQDPYEQKAKPAGPALCTGCGAVFRRGRWSWGSAPAGAKPVLCAACMRIRERQPAGWVLLDGEFLSLHREEILGLLRNKEATEKLSHPLQRIMDVQDLPGALELTTTDVHLARGLGSALHHAFQGRLEEQDPTGEYTVRVHWSR